jgi:hypothetical protein
VDRGGSSGEGGIWGGAYAEFGGVRGEEMRGGLVVEMSHGLLSRLAYVFEESERHKQKDGEGQ